MIDIDLNVQSPLVLNTDHPRPVPFDRLIAGINDGLVKQGIIPTQIPVLHIQELFPLLETGSAFQGCKRRCLQADCEAHPRLIKRGTKRSTACVDKPPEILPQLF